MSKDNGILHLVLKFEWWEKIQSGEKTIEYRKTSEHWNSKMLGCYDLVIFHKGYTSETIIFEIQKIELQTNVPNDLNETSVWAIYLGKRIK